MDVMEIATLSMSMAQMDLANKVGVAVLKNAMESQEVVISEITEMMDAPRDMGSIVDISI